MAEEEKKSASMMPGRNFVGDGYPYIVLSILGFLAFGTTYLLLTPSDADETERGWPLQQFLNLSDEIALFLASMFLFGLVISYLGKKIPAVFEEMGAGEYWRHDGRLLGLIDEAEEGVLRAASDRMAAKIYGEHNSDGRSLWQTVNRSLQDYYRANVPHKSRFRRNVTITDKGDETIGWKEMSSYRIHCPSLKEKGAEPVNYTLRFRTTSELDIGTRNLEEIIGSMRMWLHVGPEDNETVLFDAQRHLAVKGDRVVSTQDGLTVGLDGNLLNVSLETTIKLTEEFTEVRSLEDSIIRDTEYSLTTTDPIFDCQVDLQIPEGWRFQSCVADRGWNSQEDFEHRRVFIQEEWVLPGLYLYISWRR